MPTNTKMPTERLLAQAYCKFLLSIDWSDTMLVAGIREGLNKFLSNAYLKTFPGISKYHKTHLISHAALAQLNADDYRGLVFEHLVPKTRYIQAPCVKLAKTGELTAEYVHDLLVRYWKLATVTVSEDRRLTKTKMPHGWDGQDILARYAIAGIELVPNPFYPAPAYLRKQSN